MCFIKHHIIFRKNLARALIFDLPTDQNDKVDVQREVCLMEISIALWLPVTHNHS